MARRPVRKPSAGPYIIGGLKGADYVPPREHGHVVVVAGSLAHDKYPHAYWRSLGGFSGKNQTINFSWTKDDRDKVEYFAKKLDTVQFAPRTNHMTVPEHMMQVVRETAERLLGNLSVTFAQLPEKVAGMHDSLLFHGGIDRIELRLRVNEIEIKP